MKEHTMYDDPCVAVGPDVSSFPRSPWECIM